MARAGKKTGGAAAAEGLRAIVAELSAHYFEREDQIRALACAVLCREHVVMFGPPGTAKSELARDFAGRITGGRYKDLLMGRFVTPTKIFGPIDPAALLQGENKQLLDGRAARVEMLFLDEIFKCSPAALLELLALLNERIYHPENGGPPEICPLISAITASNENPTGVEELTALYDRLLVRVEVDYIQEPENFATLLLSPRGPDTIAKRTTVALEDLLDAVNVRVPAVELSRPIVNMIANVRAELRHHGIRVSDRRWHQCVQLMRASAFLDGRSAITTDDFFLLNSTLWDTPKQRPLVERAVLHQARPDEAELADLHDAINALDAQYGAMKDVEDAERVQWVVKQTIGSLLTAKKRLEVLRTKSLKAGRPTDPIDAVIVRRNQVNARLNKDALNLDDEE